MSVGWGRCGRVPIHAPTPRRRRATRRRVGGHLRLGNCRFCGRVGGHLPEMAVLPPFRPGGRGPTDSPAARRCRVAVSRRTSVASAIRIDRPAQTPQGQNLLLLLVVQDGSSGRGTSRRPRQRLGRRQLIAGFEVYDQLPVLGVHRGLSCNRTSFARNACGSPAAAGTLGHTRRRVGPR